MNELRFGNQIRQALNEGRRLDARTLERLRVARMSALERHALAREHAPRLAAEGVVGRLGGPAWFSRAVLVPLLLLALGVGFLYSAQLNRRAAEAVELDTQLLSDELPIDAYLDKGFEAWLNKRRAR